MRPTRRIEWRGVGLLVVVVMFAAGLSFSLVAGYRQSRELCDFQERSWKTQRLQILDDGKPQKPSEAILRAFPQIRPFYDKRNPLYAEQIKSLNERKVRKLRILGDRPSC